MKVIFDYKPTTQNSKCKICKKLIEKHSKRIIVDNDNEYRRETNSYHEKCFRKKMDEFFNKLPRMEI